MCLRKLKRFSLLFLFLFSLPIIIGQFPFPNNEMTTQKVKVNARTLFMQRQSQLSQYRKNQKPIHSMYC